MVDLTAPFLANDQGEVSINDSLEDMVAQIEPIDSLVASTEVVFDVSLVRGVVN